MPLHPQVASLLRAMAEDDAPPPADLAAERKEYLDSALRLGGAAEPVAGTEDVVVPSFDGARLPARVHAPLHAPEADALLVWLHGGGWYVGDLPTFDRVARVLANAAGAKVLTVEYRLAPEHRWPTQVRDAYAVLAWARGDGAAQLGIDPGRVVLGGDSAGGQLAVVAARHAPPASLRALVLAYPALDPTLSSESYKTFADGPMLTKADMERCWAFYLGDEDGAVQRAAADPDVAPLVATDLDALPPTAIALAEEDVVRDDGAALAEALDAAGVPVDLRVFEGMVHGYIRWGGMVDAAGETLRWLGERARAALDGPPPG
ncbi:MAG TPA: alpha/beta hydrolase [Baekduia sp.]|uniref:alpha/beta hydrolase n=1 Tax=Baekduia sp. TaxID=2600305 RepID=UPI002D7998F4|nr:alpha/beta hydrolase [Baekduia sp.]HET6507515.1 alpha/beta hydrolase [Baekduia sp.]